MLLEFIPLQSIAGGQRGDGRKLDVFARQLTTPYGRTARDTLVGLVGGWGSFFGRARKNPMNSGSLLVLYNVNKRH